MSCAGTAKRARTVPQAIAAGIGGLQRTQATPRSESAHPTAVFAGDWGGQVGLDVGWLRLRAKDTNAFLPACAVEMLGEVNERNRLRLGVDPRVIAEAAAIRSRAVESLARFRQPDGTFVYWPAARTESVRPLDRWVARWMKHWHGGPEMWGWIAPRGVAAYPPEFRLWPDADTTAMAWAATAGEARRTGKGVPLPDPVGLFEPVKFTGSGVLFFAAEDRLPPGIYRTFYTPKRRPEIPNDVDAVVNANILHAMAALGAADTAEARRIARWLAKLVDEGRHRDPSAVSAYYGWEHMLAAMLARDCFDDRVALLRPAVNRLAGEIEAAAVSRADGTVWWPSSCPVRTTACALLCLIRARPGSPVIEPAIRYLLQQQDAHSGLWRDGWSDMMRTTAGRMTYFRSDALASALAVDALCQYQLTLRPSTMRRTASPAATKPKVPVTKVAAP